MCTARPPRFCGVSFIRGLIAGLAVAALQVVAAHSGLSYGPLSLRGDGSLIVPIVLVPLCLLWGWTWVSDRWSGRSTPRMLSYTAALVFGAALAPVADRVAFSGADTLLPAFAPDPDLTGVVGVAPDLVGRSITFLAPAVLIAAALYWLFASRRVSAGFVTLTIGYVAALPFALVYPPVAMGAVGGTAAGHAWISPGARAPIALLVILLLVVAVLGPPFLALEAGPNPPIPLPDVLRFPAP